MQSRYTLRKCCHKLLVIQYCKCLEVQCYMYTADHLELNAQVPAESATCAEARLKVFYQRRRTTSQDVRLPGDRFHCRHRLSESAGTHCHYY